MLYGSSTEQEILTMRVRLTQIIDYWLGVPICFFLSLWRSVLSWFVRSSPQKLNPRTVLFIELSEMGSAVLAHSALEECKQQYPDARICFLIFTRNRESVDILGSIKDEDVVTISDRSFLTFVRDSLRFIVWARRNYVDAVIDLELFSRASMILSYLSGAKDRVGFRNRTSEGLYRGNLLTRYVAFNPHQHMPFNFLALVRCMLDRNVEGEYLKEDLRPLLRELPVFEPTAYERQLIWQRLQSLNPDLEQEHTLIVVNPDPGKALPMRGWPFERYRETIAKILTEEESVVFVIIGIPASKKCAMALQESFARARVIDFSGETKSLRELLTLLSMSKVILTSDSGPAHFAALTPIHSVVLFGPETATLYRPLGDRSVCLSMNLSCSPCISAFNHRHTRCTDNQCMKQLGSQLVTRQVRRALAGHSAA